MHRYYPCVSHCETFIIKYSLFGMRTENGKAYIHVQMLAVMSGPNFAV